MQSCLGCAGYPDVPEMRGVETASKESDPLSSPHRLTHEFMVRHPLVGAELRRGPIRDPRRAVSN